MTELIAETATAQAPGNSETHCWNRQFLFRRLSWQLQVQAEGDLSEMHASVLLRSPPTPICSGAGSGLWAFARESQIISSA